MMSLTFGLFTQVSDSGSDGPLVFKRGIGRGGGEETNISKYVNNFLSTNLTTLILIS